MLSLEIRAAISCSGNTYSHKIKVQSELVNLHTVCSNLWPSAKSIPSQQWQIMLTIPRGSRGAWWHCHRCCITLFFLLQGVFVYARRVWRCRATERPRCLHQTNHQRVKRSLCLLGGAAKPRGRRDKWHIRESTWRLLNPPLICVWLQPSLASKLSDISLHMARHMNNKVTTGQILLTYHKRIQMDRETDLKRDMREKRGGRGKGEENDLKGIWEV